MLSRQMIATGLIKATGTVSDGKFARRESHSITERTKIRIALIYNNSSKIWAISYISINIKPESQNSV